MGTAAAAAAKAAAGARRQPGGRAGPGTLSLDVPHQCKKRVRTNVRNVLFQVMKDWEGKHGNSSNNLARSHVQTTWHEARAGLGGQVHERIEVLSMIVKDGVVEMLNVEEGGEYKVSSAEYLLGQLS